MPGGFGSSDAFWIAHLPLAHSQTAAVLAAYRLTYYVIPWAIASLLLLSWVTLRAPRRLEIARRVVAGLVGGGGVLIMLSSASPALYARLPLLERFIPLPLVETGHVAAALAGLLLLVLARGLGRGYRAAFRFTLILLTIAGCGAILKGLDWEEAVVLGGLAIATWSQSALFDRPSRGDPWIEGPDLRGRVCRADAVPRVRIALPSRQCQHARAADDDRLSRPGAAVSSHGRVDGSGRRRSVYVRAHAITGAIQQTARRRHRPDVGAARAASDRARLR